MYFYKCFTEKNTYELHGCYENSFNKLTEKFYKSATWPDPEQDVAPLVNNDQIFLVLYSEVYYRHIYARLQPTLEHRVASYNNYCNLFNLILNNEGGPVNFELPNKWTWDIIDEFIYQFNQYSVYRSRLIRKELGGNKGSEPSEEFQYVQQHHDIWNSYSVLNALYSLIIKSNINEQLKATQAGQDSSMAAGEYGSRSLYRNLGYFSIIGLLRVHTLLGDFALALKTMEGIELNKKAFFTRVPGAHFTTYYYVGFCLLMLHRYADAIKTFSHILLYIARTKNISKSGQYDAVTRKSEQMYALLAICVALNPTRLDDSLHSGIREKYSEQFSKLQRGGQEALPVYEELFKFGAPKFITSSLPSYTNQAYNVDPTQLHLKIFMSTVKNSVLAPTLKGYLNLYATMELKKLAVFLDKTNDLDSLKSELITFKLKNRQLKWTQGDLLQGDYTNVFELDVALENDLVHVSEAKTARKFGDWFIRNTIKNYTVQDIIENPEKQQDNEKKDRKERRKDQK